MIYFISDTHFNHANIIKYCNRPFDNTYDMGEYMIEKWNSIVKEKDVVYFLGDFGFGTVEILKGFVNRLNGKKIIILGNHDRKRGINSWKNIGFEEVYKKPVELPIELVDKYNFNTILLSHEPKQCEDTTLNIHGHIHNVPLDTELYNKDNHICVSVEMINYTPISILDILKITNE